MDDYDQTSYINSIQRPVNYPTPNTKQYYQYTGLNEENDSTFGGIEHWSQLQTLY